MSIAFSVTVFIQKEGNSEYKTQPPQLCISYFLITEYSLNVNVR